MEPGVNVERLARLLGGERIRGWATVELERAEREVVQAHGWPPSAPAPEDSLIGAWTRIARAPDGGGTIVLLEPSTEGLLAAALARHDEGFLVDYVVVPGSLNVATSLARGEGISLSAPGTGPFGPERLVVGSRWGPHLILAAREREPDERG